MKCTYRKKDLDNKGLFVCINEKSDRFECECRIICPYADLSNRSLAETLFDLEKHMSGEVSNSLPDDGDDRDSVISIQIVRGHIILTSYTGIWIFEKGVDGPSSGIVLKGVL